ncbi:MAG: sigma factor-like helix-turn-helix DNA-binding protein [Chloroflexota bacterium]
MLHTGFDTIAVQRLHEYCKYLVSLHYKHQEPAEQPVTDGTPAKTSRNRLIYERYRAGESLSELATVFGVSSQRIHQIVKQSNTN